MSTTLSLGGVVFQGFEIPESINFGGEQALVVHKLPGGKRSINPMGPDDADIRWSGRFRGDSATQRATLLDFMRRQGRQVLLAWGLLHRYQVVISKFEADYQSDGREIPYSISCTVVLDEMQALASAAVGFVESMLGDLVAATGLSSIIGKDEIAAAVTGIGSALSNYQAGVPVTSNLLSGAASALEGPLLGNLTTSLSGAQSVIGSAIKSTESAISSIGSSIGGYLSGAAPESFASNLTAQASNFSLLSQLHQLESVVGRMVTNTSNAGN